MNAMRLAGDFIHLYAIIMLLRKIFETKSCSGISGRSQILFALVYITRYLDIFSYYISAYNTCMKVIFIAISWCTLHTIYFKYKATFDGKRDSFRIEFLVIPGLILALFVNYEWNVLEVCWAFSIYLESVAILPQMFMITKTGEIRIVICRYLLCMGFYRAFYIMNWVFRYYHERYYDPVSVSGGSIETIIYCIFFSLYIFKRYKTYEEAIGGPSNFFTDWLLVWNDDWDSDVSKTEKGEKFGFPPTEYNRPPPYWFAAGNNNWNKYSSNLCYESPPEYSALSSVEEKKTSETSEAIPDIIIAKDQVTEAPEKSPLADYPENILNSSSPRELSTNTSIIPTDHPK